MRQFYIFTTPEEEWHYCSQDCIDHDRRVIGAPEEIVQHVVTGAELYAAGWRIFTCDYCQTDYAIHREYVASLTR